ncbi:MAG: bifunctional diaminohydroxyphosphoribosylaminopyrimidine deaminase/5-amino-6-(5-phosphoribosylamino)uracil reductase RibD [Proteobacteria bacterium]|nr:bifunctional diaminohydroxyphosphoribosylaminopyrimidine deaminase/5-amino-6-(5-phosphoribosylamino)uracil reductase RibD [Pseudomonadota bacterium]
MNLSGIDESRLQLALALAEKSIGLSDPNPRVGCVLADREGVVRAEGWTQHAGGPHAEAHALHLAEQAGADLRGGTAWVTLEPCAHHGRTPPCCDALTRAGLSRVVVAIRDPFPQVAGEGLRRLAAAGLQVDLLPADHPLATQAREINIGFLSHVERGRPWVRLKVAMSIDGRTALPNGRSQWITGPAARHDTHAWRRRASAVLTGIGTVLADRPRLDVRLVETALQPLRVIVDSALRTPTDAPILAPPGKCLIATTSVDRARADALRAAGAEVLVSGLPGQRVDLHELVKTLARRQVNEVHVEAGAVLNGAWMAAGLVDELIVYLAPKVLGSGPAIAQFGPIEQLEQAVAWRLQEAVVVAGDLRLRFRQP